jgi:hypothetical protein
VARNCGTRPLAGANGDLPQKWSRPSGLVHSTLNAESFATVSAVFNSHRQKAWRRMPKRGICQSTRRVSVVAISQEQKLHAFAARPMGIPSVPLRANGHTVARDGGIERDQSKSPPGSPATRPENLSPATPGAPVTDRRPAEMDANCGAIAWRKGRARKCHRSVRQPCPPQWPASLYRPDKLNETENTPRRENRPAP